MRNITVTTDLQSLQICHTPQPSTQDANPESQPADSTLCISLFVLLLPYLYLLYRYMKSLYRIRQTNRSLSQLSAFDTISIQNSNKLDRLDKWLIAVSLLRLLLFIGAGWSNEAAEIYEWASPLSLLIWQTVLAFIFLRFSIENGTTWRYIIWTIILSYAVYVGIFVNYLALRHQNTTIDQSQTQTLTIHFPTILPLVCLNLLIVLIGGREFRQLLLEEGSSSNRRQFTENILIQLKNRKSFIFQSVVTSLCCLILRVLPFQFIQILGNVLYFLLSDWIQILVVYRCVVRRVQIKEYALRRKRGSIFLFAKDDEGRSSGIDEGLLNERDSKKIVIEMEQFSSTKRIAAPKK